MPQSPLEAPPVDVDSLSTTCRIDQAMRALSCSRRHIYNLIDEGKLSAISISLHSPLDPDGSSTVKHLRVLTNSLKRFLNERRV